MIQKDPKLRIFVLIFFNNVLPFSASRAQISIVPFKNLVPFFLTFAPITVVEVLESNKNTVTASLSMITSKFRGFLEEKNPCYFLRRAWDALESLHIRVYVKCVYPPTLSKVIFQPIFHIQLHS